MAGIRRVRHRFRRLDSGNPQLLVAGGVVRLSGRGHRNRTCRTGARRRGDRRVSPDCGGGAGAGASLRAGGLRAGGAATRVGLGWRIALDSLGRTYLHHGGTSVGGRAFLLVYPERGVAVALLANTEANFGEAEALAFARLALDPPPEESRQLLPRR